jgi:hypothetical protein
MKQVVSGGTVRAVAFTQAVAGLPDTTFFILVLVVRYACGQPVVFRSQNRPDWVRPSGCVKDQRCLAVKRASVAEMPAP